MSQTGQTESAPKSSKPPAAPNSRKGAPNLGHPTYYINRELSWVSFNERVLEEALDEKSPVLERVKFLAIFASNLDEFFMIRVSGLRRQLAGGVLTAPADGTTPAAVLATMRKRLLPMIEAGRKCWEEDLLPRLREAGIRILAWDDLSSKQRKTLRQTFKTDIFPTLTPMAFDPSHPFAHISNLSLNLAVVVNHPERGECFARLKVPHMLDRFVRLPKSGAKARLGLEETTTTSFVPLEEVVVANLDLLFPGVEVVAAYPFRVTRDADFEIEEDEASDLLTAMEGVVGMRHFGSVVRLEHDRRMSERVRTILLRNLNLAPYQVYAIDGLLGASDLMELMKLDRPDLKDPGFLPADPPAFSGKSSVFAVLAKRDVLLYHPYDSFRPVVNFLRTAARDPNVLAIKQTLYRVGPDSPIVGALKEARENGKQVTALIELKARFDEQNNIVWTRDLEQAGVHVVYGMLGLKTHAKMCLVVRREPDGIMRYVHVGTGNYNPVTARLYTDLGLFTSDPDLAQDVSDLFNALTGYSKKEVYKKLLVAPGRMRTEFLARIDREIKLHKKEGGGHVVFKLNSLVDKACIRKLYHASQAGVKVDLQIRGVCCLRPGVPRVSENITVTSVVGRFLEHTRIYYFRNGGDEEILLGSADLMPRNLDNRVEILFPIESAPLRRSLQDDILFLHLRDNVQSRRLNSDESYERLAPGADEAPVNSQEMLLQNSGAWHAEE